MTEVPKRLPTIIDVAERAGLSKSVVGRVLSGEGSVSSKSRDRVLKAASDLGYVVNAMARIRADRTNTFGVLVRDPGSPFYGALQGALQSRAHERSIRLVFTAGRGGANLSAEQQALQALLSLRVDGLLICSSVLPAGDLLPFAQRSPTVVVGRPEYDDRLGSVFCDEEDGTEQLGSHLTQLGHRDVGVILIPSAVAPTLHVRSNLMIAALQARGLNAHVVNIESKLGLPHAVRTLLRMKVSAIMAPNDGWAISILEHLKSIDRLHAVSVSGYDGIGVAASPLLGLTTIRQPIAEIGSLAIDQLVDEASDQISPRHIALKGTLMTGETVRRA